ncbi:MAG: alpha/beta hydrolase [Actinomycetota bacterium]|nr:alpha/beta hydrolase [Actinomycetota bacterium]
MSIFRLRKIIADPGSVGLDFQDIYFWSGGDIKLHGWFVPCTNSDKTILVFHGNGGNISHRLQLIRILHSIGLSVFIIDYRGYGRSRGKPTEEGTYADGMAAMDYLINNQGLKKEDIIVYGRSLGRPYCSQGCGWLPPLALVLDSTFTSIKEFAAQLHPGLPVRKFFKFNYPTIKWVAEVRCPVLLFHSQQDGYIPYSHARELFKNIKVEKKLVTIMGDHSDGYMVSEEKYRESLGKFIFGIDKPGVNN